MVIPKGAIKQGVGFVDNVVCQPAKQALAGVVAAKGALVGSAICPGIGTAIGAGIGYFGTLLGWGPPEIRLLMELWMIRKGHKDVYKSSIK